tara:strand:+ start:1557 stop:2447 length:891 start_codon:yes stop_codon:yes gene_type:complete
LEDTQKNNIDELDQSRVYVLFYSFFLLPLMITIFGVMFFLIVKFLTFETEDPYDLLNNIKFGSASKRWQSAYELSKILSDEELIPSDNSFKEMFINAYQKSTHDDYKVKMYLILAMGKTKDVYYGDALMGSLNDELLDIRLAAIQSLGQLRYTGATDDLSNFVMSSNYNEEVLASIISLGQIGDKKSISLLKQMLNHEEPNIRWDSAIALAKMNNDSGKFIINDLLNRQYYDSYKNVDQWEEDKAVMTAVQISSQLKDPYFKKNLVTLATYDSNMEIRNTAIQILRNVYNLEISNG